MAVEHSLLLPRLFEALSEDPGDGVRLTVLDIGPAVPETVAFFGRYRCRLIFADLFPEAGPEDPLQLLEYPVQTQFDLCLFWDYLNLLSVEELKRFNTALRPFVHSGTLAHGFGAMNATRSLPIYSYGILSAEELNVRPDPAGRSAARPHAQTTLKETLSCLELKRGTLLREGRLEVLFQGL